MGAFLGKAASEALSTELGNKPRRMPNPYRETAQRCGAQPLLGKILSCRASNGWPEKRLHFRRGFAILYKFPRRHAFLAARYAVPARSMTVGLGFDHELSTIDLSLFYG